MMTKAGSMVAKLSDPMGFVIQVMVKNKTIMNNE